MTIFLPSADMMTSVSKRWIKRFIGPQASLYAIHAQTCGRTGGETVLRKPRRTWSLAQSLLLAIHSRVSDISLDKAELPAGSSC